jgi:putative flippase GtrA
MIGRRENAADADADADARCGWLTRLARQGVGFSVVGGLQLLLDWGVMMALSASGVPLPVANVAGRVAGASLGFWSNRRYTFHGHAQPPLPQLLRFALLWSVLTTASTLGVAFAAAHGGLARAWLFKPMIEAVLAVISFFSCRLWVYR